MAGPHAAPALLRWQGAPRAHQPARRCVPENAPGAGRPIDVAHRHAPLRSPVALGPLTAGAPWLSQDAGGHCCQERAHRLGPAQQGSGAAAGLIGFELRVLNTLQPLMNHRSDRRPDTPVNSAARIFCRLRYGNRARGFLQGQSTYVLTNRPVIVTQSILFTSALQQRGSPYRSR